MLNRSFLHFLMVFQSGARIPKSLHGTLKIHQKEIKKEMKNNPCLIAFNLFLGLDFGYTTTSLFPNPTKNCSYEHKDCIRIWSGAGCEGVNALDVD